MAPRKLDQFLATNGWKRWIAVSAVVLAMTAALASQTTPRPNRITQELTSGPVVTLSGTLHPLVLQASDMGEVSPGMRLESMTLSIAPSIAEKAELDALIEAQQNPKSAQYHQWLTQEAFGARFGLTEADLSQVTGWLETHGFTVRNVAPSRNLITFSGTVAQAEVAFRTKVHRYRIGADTRISNATEIAIPQGLANVVAGVGGLSGFRPKPQTIVKHVNPQFTSQFSGNHFLTSGDWATIYNVTSIYRAGYTGTGMHVGIAGQTYFPQADVDDFRAAAGLGATKLNMVCISTADCTDVAGESVGDVGEADLDVEWSGGIAPNATVDFVYAAADDPGQDVFSAAVYLVTTYKVYGALVPVISISYASCETQFSANMRASFDGFLEEAAAQGQSVLNSSGDAGAAGCDQGGTIATQGAVADYPASSPYVTGVGGTTFSADGSAGSPEPGANQYWSYSSTADIISSALRYIPETSWNDTSYDQSQDPTSTLTSGGGGVSLYYAMPSWQWAPGNFSGVPMRFVPDVAFSASADHDAYLLCSQEFTSATDPSQTDGPSCVDGFRDSNSDLMTAGGTSASSPSFAGMLTLLVEKYGKQGNFNQTLYSLAADPTSYAAIFHDITTGSNAQPCTAGSKSCVGGLVGYEATAGYDLVTGLGSVNGGALYAALAPPSYTLGASSNSITIQAGSNAQLNLSLTATNYPGTVSFATSINSIDGTPSAVSASAPSVSFASSMTGNSTLTITATKNAANRSPRLPWKSGGPVMFCAVLLGAPFARRRNQLLAVLLTALAILAAGVLVGCSGSGGSSTPSPQTYTVTVTPTGSGTVINPAAISVTVTIQ
jgi:subtilase family serine protease